VQAGEVPVLHEQRHVNLDLRRVHSGPVHRRVVSTQAPATVLPSIQRQVLRAGGVTGGRRQEPSRVLDARRRVPTQ